MTTSATDNGGDQRVSTVEVPYVESLEQLDAHFEQTYGPDVLRTLKDSNLDQAAIVQELHKYGLNGRSEAVERTYRLHQQEFARKETLLGTTWRWTKNAAGFAGEVALTPFRWAGQAFMSHPVLFTAAGVALAAWQLPAILSYLGGIEGAEAAGALAKSGEYLRSFLPFSTGTGGVTPDPLFRPRPGGM